MEAVQKAVSDAVQAVRNSPLLRRRFNRGREEETGPEVEHPVVVSPSKDSTPFIQGFSYRVQYMGKSIVETGHEQDHGCTDKAVELLWTDDDASDIGKPVSVKVTTNYIRIKLTQDKTIIYEFPVLKVSYCGLDTRHKQAVSFVAKEDNKFCCYVFKASTPEKAYALALSISKAFYLACQIVQEQQGLFPATPERDLLFEPQRDDDTKVSPLRPHINSPLSYQIHTAPDSTLSSDPAYNEESSTHPDETTDSGDTPQPPNIAVTRPSITSTTSSLASSMDEDFFRLARSRSNPDMLRSTLGHDEVTHPSLDMVREHADPLSHSNTPIGTPSGSTENLLNL